MPIISVIVPVYQTEPYLRRCVDSILAQSFSDFELILVDDGSPDNCGAICDEYANRDDRVRVIHRENGGLSAARNAGIDLALSGSNSLWLTFIDSDDWVNPDYLHLLYSAARYKSVYVSICGFRRMRTFEMPNYTFAQRKTVVLTPEEFWCKKYINATVAWAKLYRKSLFRSIRYPVGMISEDEFTTYRLLFSQKQISFVPAPLYCYFQNPDGIMGSKWKNTRLAVLDAYEQQIRYFTENGFSEARAFDIRQHVAWCVDKLQRLRKQWFYAEARKGRRMIREKLRRFLELHREDLSVSEYREAYKAAFPRCFRFRRLPEEAPADSGPSDPASPE